MLFRGFRMTTKKFLRICFPDTQLHSRFKQFVAIAQTSMSGRIIDLILWDIKYWEKTGKARDLNENDG